jgi:thioredoxin reductase
MTVDVVIAGGGPAGLNAALVLGRAQRSVVLTDTGEPRNAPVHAMHGFLSRDGANPSEFRGVARHELHRYPSVEIHEIGIENARRDGEDFELCLGDGKTARARRLLLATGVADDLPPIAGLADRWGRSVFNCPYCDGWEHRNEPLAVLGSDFINVFIALSLVRWSPDLVLCTNGTELDDGSLWLLNDRGIALRTESVLALEGDGDTLERIIFASGPPVARHAVFFHPPTRQRGDLARQLGCAFLDDGSVQVDDLGHTTIPGVFAAGDMARRPTMPLPGAFVVIAAAEGATAAVAIDQELLFETLA